MAVSRESTGDEAGCFGGPAQETREPASNARQTMRCLDRSRQLSITELSGK